MGVAFKSATSAGAYAPAGGTITVTKPGAVVAGDLLVAVMFTTGGTMTPPDADWALIGSEGITSGVSIGRAWYKFAGGSEPASYDWAMSTGDSAVLMMSAYTGAHTSSPIDQLTWGGSTSPTTLQIAPSQTSTEADTMLICAWAAVGGSGAYTPPVEMTELADVTTAWQFGAAAYEAHETAGATGTRVATCNASVAYLSVSITLLPAGGSDADEATVWIDADGGLTNLDVEWSTEGRFMPPIAFDEDGVPGQPGLRLRTVRHREKDFVLPLWITDTSETLLRARLRTLIAKMDPTRGDGRIRVTGPGGDQREITCRYKQGLELVERLGQTSAARMQRAPVVFRAHNPYWSDVNDTIVGPLAPDDSPGSFFPFFPLRLSSSEVFAALSVDNIGDVDCWPVWTIVGPGSSITLRNLTTGKVLSLDGTLAAGETLVIDTRPRKKTVRHFSGSIETNWYTNLSATSALWCLRRGSNSLQIEMGAATSASSVTLARRHLYLAV